MNIVHVIEAFGGGAFQSTCLLVNELAKVPGNQVTLIYNTRPQTPANYQSFLLSGVRLIQAQHMQRELNPGRDLKAFFELRKLLKELNPEVLHLHCSKAGFIGRALAWFGGVPQDCKVFYSPRGFAFLDAQSKKKAWLYQTLESIAGRFFPGTVVGCSKDEAQIARSVVKAKRIAQIDNAVVLEPILNAIGHRKMPRASHQPIVVASTGRICEQKFPEFFDMVAGLVKQAAPGAFEFVWMGKDLEFNFRHMDQVYGWLPQQEMLDWMSANADVYVQASRFEGLPIAVMQCQMLGICTMVSQVPGNTSVVEHEKTGLISELKAAPFAQALLRLQDDGLRESLASAGKAYATEQFVPSRLIGQYLKLYKSA